MQKLATLQKEVFSTLMHDIPPHKKNFKKNKSLSAEESLSIYQNSSRAALLNVLRETYAVCVKITGDEFFDAMAMLYINETPSKSPNIDHYGESFPEFIASFPYAKQLPYLSDVARLEWAWHKALHAENVEKFNSTSLAQLPEKDHPNVIFQLPPSATMVASSYPIHDIWHFNQEDYEGEPTISLDKGGVKLLVWRQNMDMRIDVLEKDEWDFLSAIKQGIPIGDLDEFLTEDQCTHMSDMLASFVRKEWIFGYCLTHPSSTFFS